MSPFGLSAAFIMPISLLNSVQTHVQLSFPSGHGAHKQNAILSCGCPRKNFAVARQFRHRGKRQEGKRFVRCMVFRDTQQCRFASHLILEEFGHEDVGDGAEPAALAWCTCWGFIASPPQTHTHTHTHTKNKNTTHSFMNKRTRRLRKLIY